MSRTIPPARRRLQDSLERGAVEIRTRGLAMRPLLQPGDRVRLERRTPREGDVALVEIGQRLLLHRLVRRRGQTWWVRGDTGAAGLGIIHEGQVVAIATERLREAQGHPRWLPLDSSNTPAERFRAWLRHPLDPDPA